MMHMTFYWGKKVTLLIDSWKTDSWTSYLLSLLACLLVAAFYQFMENHRLRLKLISAPKSSPTQQIKAPLLRSKFTDLEIKMPIFYGYLVRAEQQLGRVKEMVMEVVREMR
ncbi:hypothetical protein L6164_021544 [Bauhinia variegata]|uniref:Uncharacterized protein n=1 Tax=Bauhinia variegata TaxID=167791 RepID=A0ACB9MYV1_BAUVA|nr:hypothetical protein L6164_021544 [Bauhinia variegata]